MRAADEKFSRAVSSGILDLVDGYSAASGQREFRCRPGVQTPINKSYQQGNDNTTKSAPEPTVEENRPAVAICFKKGMSQPGAQNASGYASEDATLKQECANPSQRTAAEKSNHHRGRDDPDCEQNSGHGT